MTDLAGRRWRLVRDRAADGATQMAAEVAVAETAGAGGRRTVRTYTWCPSTVSLGYRTDVTAIDREFCREHGIDVIRRQTGGGAIYHDSHADISYTIVVPADEVPGDLMESYRLLCEPILTAFDRLGVDAGFAATERPSIHEPSCYLRGVHPAHDVVADGKKIAGNAQYRPKDAVIQHGSLSFALEPERHLGVFADHDVDVERFRERVTGIAELVDVDRETAVEAIEGALADWVDAEVGELTDEERDRTERIAAEKFDTGAWTDRREGPETV
ncbi:lipase [Halobacteriales archaeon SW_7_68_16]|nr:MAG: lipase [Halobacteriales archaeon SW_7_68_16]